jgi:hypothetical protein
MMLNGVRFPVDPEETAWIQLVVSEQAFVESSIAIGMRQWSPKVSYQELALHHSSNAADILVQHIQSGKPHTDAVIAAVATMAFGERLARNDMGWQVHINGLTQLIRERRTRNANSLPQWFYNLLILSVIPLLLGSNSDSLTFNSGIPQMTF